MINAVLLAATFAIVHTSVVDPAAASVASDMTIVVRDGRIASVGRAEPPKGVTTIDGRGRYVIPGLCDMHVHLSDLTPDDVRNIVLPLLIAQGITTVRDAGGDPALLDALKADVANGKLPGPAIYRAGLVIDGPKPEVPFRITVTKVAAARDAVRYLAREGSDFIKVHNGVSRPVFDAVMAEARRQHIPVAVHLPASISMTHAVIGGVQTIEHSETLLESGLRVHKLAGSVADANTVLDALLGSEGDALFASMVRHHTWFDPTFVEYDAFAHENESRAPAKYLAPSLRDFWNRLFPMAEPVAESRLAVRQAIFAKFLKVVGRMSAHGVPLLTGTDLGAPGVQPGFALHDELRLLVRAGVTSRTALQAATLNAARALGRPDAGHIRANDVADLVILEADPLQSIDNTRRIAGVVVRGRYLDRSALDQLLQQVEKAAGSH
jgi:imidazolonepropionase-like amidohydrolase